MRSEKTQHVSFQDLLSYVALLYGVLTGCDRSETASRIREVRVLIFLHEKEISLIRTLLGDHRLGAGKSEATGGSNPLACTAIASSCGQSRPSALLFCHRLFT